MARKDWVVVGSVAKPHGVAGELSVVCHAQSPDIFDRVSGVLVRGGGKPDRLRAVVSWRMHQDRVLLRLEGVTDRNRAEELRGAELCVRTSDLPPPDQGEVYLYQLEGCAVRLADGSRVGVLEGFLEIPGQQTWVIRADGGREILFPAVRSFILSVDLDREEVVIDPPEGLLELYLGDGPGR